MGTAPGALNRCPIGTLKKLVGAPEHNLRRREPGCAKTGGHGWLPRTYGRDQAAVPTVITSPREGEMELTRGE
jgi:hypothetical protein